MVLQASKQPQHVAEFIHVNSRATFSSMAHVNTTCSMMLPVAQQVIIHAAHHAVQYDLPTHTVFLAPDLLLLILKGIPALPQFITLPAAPLMG